MQRSIYIGNPAHLKLHQEQLEVHCPTQQNCKGRVPIEDMALLMLDHPQITLTQPLLQKLMAHHVMLVSCDAQHLPHGIMLPLYGHSEHSERARQQLAASEVLKKQLWKQIVEAKIHNQMQILKQQKAYFAPMQEYMAQVKSGDSSNMEGVAAQHYWRHLFGDGFLRGRYEAEPNHLFNFAYAILRSFVARALVDTGLLPVLGLFHKNKYNPYCLADDMMEAYRPYADQLVLKWLEEEPDSQELSKACKAHLLSMASLDVRLGSVTKPLMLAIKSTCVSLYQCYSGEKRQLLLPKIP